jgi:hypothetical protein
MSAFFCAEISSSSSAPALWSSQVAAASARALIASTKNISFIRSTAEPHIATSALRAAPPTPSPLFISECPPAADEMAKRSNASS